MHSKLFKSSILLLVLPLMMWGAAADDLKKQIAEREQEIKKLEAEIAEYQKLFAEQSGVSQTLGGEIKRLEAQIKKLNADIKLAEQKIQKTTMRISELSDDIGAHTAELTKDKAVLTELLQSLNESDGQTLIEAFFANDRLTDFISDRERTAEIQKTIELEMVELRRKKEVLEEQKESKEREEADYRSFKKDLTGKKSAQESTSQIKNKLLRDSKNQESRYQSMLKEREEKRKLIAKEIDAIEDELKKLIDPSLLPSKRKGVLLWPVDSPFITQGFGRTDFAATVGDVYNGGGHNGIDLRASPGTRVLAAEAGAVKDAGNTDKICPGGSYGNWIIVEHQNNLSTLYAHLSSVALARGSAVSRGDIIGYSGNTGYSTGPHLHFTVYATNTYRLHKTKHCGLVPAGGYLNPLDYL